MARSSEADEVTLTYSDDGRGLESEGSPTGCGADLRLTLIETLATQLRGELGVSGDADETTYVLKFPQALEAARA